ncbi:MAG: hypothetical protein ACKOHK_11330, partial [Planctomycetia bacterium]
PRRLRAALPGPGVDRRRRKDGPVIVFGGRGILLDVEGTTSSISFVYDVLFAFAKKHVGEFLVRQRLDPAVQAAAEDDHGAVLPAPAIHAGPRQSGS